MTDSSLFPYQLEFIEFAIARDVLQFGEFQLKSGRISPYFFNSGLFNDGESLGRLGDFYARALNRSAIHFDMIFGPAYKGIPLASALAISLHEHYHRSVRYCFNRKETKDHGEGGNLLGAPLSGQVLIIDDVITAGTSVNESVKLIHAAGAEPVAVLIALDRQERGNNNQSAVQAVRQQHGISVISIITLEALISYLQQTTQFRQHLDKIQLYRNEYGTHEVKE